MRRIRLIPVLLLRQSGIYKTTKFRDPVYIGDPLNTIRLLNDMEIDELIVLDIAASKEGRKPNFDYIEEMCTEAFMPFTYGGGISTVDDASKLFRRGVEKIVLNTVASIDDGIVRKCADQFGSQSIIVGIDYGNRLFSRNRQYLHSVKKYVNRNVLDAALHAENNGAGELFLMSIDRDGAMCGVDLETISVVSKSIQIPLIACGGVGSLEHIKEAADAGSSAVAGGSFFVYHGNTKGILISYPSQKELDTYLS